MNIPSNKFIDTKVNKNWLKKPVSGKTLKSAEKTAARAKFEKGPEKATKAESLLGFWKLIGFTGVGFAHPNTGPWKTSNKRGSISVPRGSIWTIGFKLIRPESLAVGSPRKLAEKACAASWMVITKLKITRKASTVKKISTGFATLRFSIQI